MCRLYRSSHNMYKSTHCFYRLANTSYVSTHHLHRSTHTLKFLKSYILFQFLLHSFCFISLTYHLRELANITQFITQSSHFWFLSTLPHLTHRHASLFTKPRENQKLFKSYKLSLSNFIANRKEDLKKKEEDSKKNNRHTSPRSTRK